MQLLTGLHSGCCDAVAPDTFEIFCLSAVHVEGRTLKCLDLYDQSSPGLSFASAESALQHEPISNIKMEVPSGRKAAPLDAIEDGDVEDHDLLRSGYGFSDDVASSNVEAQQMDDELGTEVVQKEQASRIRQALHGKQKPGKQKQASAADARCDDVSLLDQAVELVREMHAASNITLTSAELEEEAVLMLVRQMEKDKEKAKKLSGSSSQLHGPASGFQHGEAAPVDEVQQLFNTHGSQRPGMKQKYACFEDDGAFLQEVLAQQEQDSSSSDCDEAGEPAPDERTQSELALDPPPTSAHRASA